METLSIDLVVCRLRPFRRDDDTSIAHHADDRAVWINLRDRFPSPYHLEDARDWLGMVVGQTPSTDFAIEVEGHAVGSVGITLGADVFRRSAEIGYWLGRSFWGRGIASAAVRAVTEHAFEQFDLNRLHAGVFAWNPASARVLEKAGYVLEGRLRSAVTKDGRTTDQLLYAITRE
jgi:[ribosomal protein S5]-alanine N-acetyltransferase